MLECCRAAAQRAARWGTGGSSQLLLLFSFHTLLRAYSPPQRLASLSWISLRAGAQGTWHGNARKQPVP